MKMLTRRGVLVEEMGQTYLAEPDADGEEARTLRPLQVAAVTYRIAFGPRAGQKVLTLRGAMPREDWVRQPLCADIDGFSLHAAVRVDARDRKRLEQLCRYITRPALLPRPRLHHIRFHGVLAPNAKLRPLVVPQAPQVQEADTDAAAPAECEVETVQARPQHISWARLLKRVFDIDMQHCPNCGAGELKIIASILERPVIEKILTHLGLSPDTNSPVDSLCLAKGPATGRARPARLEPQPPPRGRAREVVQD